jgi:uncharacterized ubiquitin-like protein YukD
MINIHVTSSYGYGDFDIKVPENISIQKLKDKIKLTLKSIIKKNQNLYYGPSKLIDDTKTIKDYQIRDGSIIYFSILD